VALLDDLVDELLQNFTRLADPYLDASDATGWRGGSTTRDYMSVRLSECLMDLAFESKHPSFVTEREWRVYCENGPILFRARQGQIVPYRELDITSNERPDLIAVEEIVMGPRLTPLDTERVLTYIADTYGYGHAGIQFLSSRAPYR